MMFGKNHLCRKMIFQERNKIFKFQGAMNKKSGKGLKTFSMAVLVLMFSAYIGDQEVISDLRERLGVYNSTFHKEKAYLFTDRYIYHAGEMIWFRGFVTSANGTRESYSEDFYIKMYDSNGEEIFFRRYPLADNMTSGKLQLPGSLIPGKYRIMAYTGWMKNQPPEDVFSKEILVSEFIDKRMGMTVFFDHMVYSPGDTMSAIVLVHNHEGIPMKESEFTYSLETFGKQLVRGTGVTDESGNGRISEVIPDIEGETIALSVEPGRRNTSGRYSVYVPVLNSVPGISFMPEAGNLVRGFETAVFIEARDGKGMPVSVQGELYDENNTLIATTSTGFNGKGRFKYTPGDAGHYLKIVNPLVEDVYYKLPAADEKGTVIRLDSINNDSAFFTLMTTQNDSLIVVAVAKNNIVWHSAVPAEKIYSFAVPVARYKGRIMQVTVFNKKSEPLSERVLEIPVEKALNLTANRKNFLQRQRVTLTLEYTGNEAFLDLALSVAPQNMSEHRGMQTFRNSMNEGNDNVISLYHHQETESLIVPVTKPVDWRTLMNSTEIEPWSNQDGLSGMVIDRKDNISQLAKVRVTHIPGYRSFETQTDNMGQFRIFFGKDVIDFNYLNIEAYDASGRINLNTAIDYNFSEQLKISTEERDSNVVNEKLRDLLSYGDPDIIYALRYSPAKLRKDEKTTNRRYDPYSYREFSNTLDIIRDIRDYDIVDGRIIFRETNRGAREKTNQNSAIIVINGVLWGDRIDILNSITPSDITNLIISSSLSDIHRYTSIDFAAVIEITTIQGMYRYRQRNFQPLRDLTGPRIDFNSPDYSVETITSPDNRKTLYWNPEIRLTPGSPVTLSFFTSDVRGIFTIRAEGMDAGGTPFTVSEKITVE